jgi:hypothetical protein
MASSKSTTIYRRWGMVAILAIISWLLRTHLSAQAIPEVAELAHFLTSEQRRFSVLTYSQTYMDDDHERVSYRGTLYNAIHSVGLKGCEVVADVAVEDRFSGAIRHRTGVGGSVMSRLANWQTILFMNTGLALPCSIPTK